MTQKNTTRDAALKLTKEETDAFAAIGDALAGVKDCKDRKSEKMPFVASAIANNHERFVAGVTVAGYRFKLTVREELSAVKV